MKFLLARCQILLIVILFIGCSEDVPDPLPYRKINVPIIWADFTLSMVRHLPNNSPTYTSRALGYMGVAMYECVVHGSAQHKSLSGQLNGLIGLPIPESDYPYSWEIALNAGQARMLKHLYENVLTFKDFRRIDSLENAIYNNEAQITTPESSAKKSREFGRAVADVLINWAKTDGGHGANLKNFDPEYRFPHGPGLWFPPFAGQSTSLLPLHPHWGGNRTFVSANARLPIPEMIPYSTDPGSAYYQQFLEVYEKRKSLTIAEKNIAVWWADDPSVTSSPPGHSYNLATQYVLSTEASLFAASEIYAKVGMAVADSFIQCWKCKYHYHAERPFPYIVQFIDGQYAPFWPEPPFPAFTSGHATQSSAAAIVLISVIGNDRPITDRTHANRKIDWPEVSYTARTFETIWQTAEECAYSRFLGGIHTRQDNEAGTAQGVVIGENISSLQWKN